MSASAIPMVLSVVGGVMDFMGQRDQADAQERAAQQQAAAAEESRRLALQNAAAIEAETAETARRERQAAEQEKAQRRGRLAASGGMETGSSKAWIESQDAINQEYVDWLERAGGSRASITRAEGDIAAATGKAQSELTKSQAEATRGAAFGSLVSGAQPAVTELWSWGRSNTSDIWT